MDWITILSIVACILAIAMWRIGRCVEKTRYPDIDDVRKGERRHHVYGKIRTRFRRQGPDQRDPRQGRF